MFSWRMVIWQRGKGPHPHAFRNLLRADFVLAKDPRPLYCKEED